MKYIADLHLHSKYSRATSRDLDIENNARWARWKGIDVLGTADFTHPIWFSELKESLEADPGHRGLLRLKDQTLRDQLGGGGSPKFIFSVETSHIYKQAQETHRVHLVTLAPDFYSVEQIQKALLKQNVNISSDGRPIMGLSCPEYMDLVLTINEDCLVFPAHVWTPWFSLYGSMSGFDSIEDCFQEFSPFVYAIETGLSSDPAMNWRVPELDERAVISFSDAHSPSKLGREITILEGEMSYLGVISALKAYAATSLSPISEKPLAKIVATVEFYPEEGKYHYTGHRNCQVSQSPEETARNGVQCSVCGKSLTVGVMQRVENLARRKISLEQLKLEHDQFNLRWVGTPKGLKPAYAMLVPLNEILAEALEVGVNTKTVHNMYTRMVNQLDSEFKILMETDLNKIKLIADDKIAKAIDKVRRGDLVVQPGYDGQFGEVRIFGLDEQAASSRADQENLFQG